MTTHDPLDYDPDEDPDADPGMLNPRTGAAAHDEGGHDDDTDANPGSMNPHDLRPGVHDEPEG